MNLAENLNPVKTTIVNGLIFGEAKINQTSQVFSVLCLVLECENAHWYRLFVLQ